jgi:type IV fimbrial biogenesis protein FimT
MLLTPNRERGITIIEQLIGLAVTGVMLAMGLPNYSDYLQNRHIRTQAESLVDGLQLARIEAVRRNEGIEFRINGNDWAIIAEAGDTIQARDGAETARARVALGGGGATLNVRFNSLGRITSGNAATDINIEHASGACQTNALGSAPNGYRCLRVQMAAGGQVRLCDPRLDAADTQACL